MKLVYVTHESFLDHSYTIIKTLRKKCDLKVFIQAKKMNAELEEWCRILDGEFIKRKRFRNPAGFFDAIGFMRRIKKIRGDAVWFNSLSVYQGLLARLIIKNFFVTVHDVEYHPDSRDYHSFLSLWLTFKLLKKRICVVSKTQAELFEQKYGIKPKVFQLPIIDYYKEIGKSDLPGLKNLTGQQVETVKFFFFGSIEPYKGIETLIEAAEILEKRKTEYKLNIYGKIKYSVSEVTNGINRLKNVSLYDEFIDYKDIHRIYMENDVLILPYKQVTQCGPLLIGYAEGVPSICNNLQGFREYVDDGKSGIIYSNSAQELAEKMESIIKGKEKLKEMKRYIETETCEKFSMEALAEEYMGNFK